VLSLARLLDLNSLHNLSLTCRQIRGTLLLFRDQLVTRTLRCVNETDGGTGTETSSADDKDSRETQRGGISTRYNLSGPPSLGRRMTAGKVGQCARDMVGECRKCGEVICRVRFSLWIPLFSISKR
jgi:hypothetical protein